MYNKKWKCHRCCYETDKKQNFEKHINRQNACDKRLKRTSGEKNVNPNDKNVNPGEKNVNPNDKNVNPGEKNVNPNNKSINNCKYCNKDFSSKSYLMKHEKKCNGLNSLQCPTCKKTFTSREGKYKHMKNVKCVVVLTEEQQRIKELEEQLKEKDKQLEEERAKPTTVINNNTTNNTYNYFNPNINYNNYDNLSMDHITKDDIKRMFDNCRMKYPELSEDLTRLILSIKENQCIFLPEGQKSNTCIVHKDGKEQRKPAVHVLMNLGSQVGMLIRNSNAIEKKRGDLQYAIFWGDNRNACGLDRIAVDEMSIVDKEIVQRNKNVVMDTCVMGISNDIN